LPINSQSPWLANGYCRSLKGEEALKGQLWKDTKDGRIHVYTVTDQKISLHAVHFCNYGTYSD